MSKHLLAVGAGVLDGQQQLVEAQYAPLGALLALHGATQFRGADGGGAELADDDAGGEIGQGHGLRQVLASSDGAGQGGNHRVASTGDVEHFAGAGRQVQGAVAGAQQGHAVFATGDQQRTELQLGHQLLALGNQVGFIGAATDDGFEFGEVRGDQAGATVDGEVLALGIGQHRDIAFARGLDQCLVVLQRALAVVGEHQHTDLVQQRFDIGGQRHRVGAEGFLEVHAQQLLVAAHDPQLDDGRLAGDALEAGGHAHGLQAVAQAVGGLVDTSDADQEGRCAEGGKVQRDVGGAAGAVLMLLDPHHGHRRLGRDARGRAVPVAVEHHVADY